ncbi:MAG: IS1595 family transposase [Chthoniobacteraceae bacterium]
MKNKYLKSARISEAKFRGLLKLFAEDVPATTTTKLLRLNYNTTHRLYTLLRQRIMQLTREEFTPFFGDVEVDESYFGPTRLRGNKGRMALQKFPVLGLHKRGERVFVSVVKNCSKEALMPILRGNILGESDVYTDGWKAYDGLVTDGYHHHRVFHHENEFVRGKNHVNGIESFWSFAKLRLSRLNGIRPNRFFMHLKECEWRFNHRHDNIYYILRSSCRHFPLSAR